MVKHLFAAAVLVATFQDAGTARAAYFQTALSCDNEAILVQIDLAERRSLQVVVNDPNIRRYFATELIKGRPGVPTNEYPVAVFPAAVIANPDNRPFVDQIMEKGLALRESLQDGVWRSQDLKGWGDRRPFFTDRVDSCYSAWCDTNTFSPVTIGERRGDGLRLEIWRPRRVLKDCKQFDSEFNCLEWFPETGYEALLLADWNFARCEVRPILP